MRHVAIPKPRKIKRHRVTLTLDDLPSHSDWPKRLLSMTPYEIKPKTRTEVLREFDREKWGSLLEIARTLKKPTLRQLENASLDLGARIACFDDGKFYLTTRRDSLNRQCDLIAAALAPHVRKASCLVELGAGYGSMLFRLAPRQMFASLPIYAAEFTPSGRELLKLLAPSIGQTVRVGNCDLGAMTIEDIGIPPNALIFTSFAVHYVPQLSHKFVSFLSRLQPRAVVHCEPCYELYDTDSLHGLMCRRYVELNDYSRNLLSVIERAKGISTRVQKNVMGSNPFLPFSVIEWCPSGTCD
jgi:hypothetical protein